MTAMPPYKGIVSLRSCVLLLAAGIITASTVSPALANPEFLPNSLGTDERPLHKSSVVTSSGNNSSASKSGQFTAGGISKGFCSNPFALEHREPPNAKQQPRQQQQVSGQSSVQQKQQPAVRGSRVNDSDASPRQVAETPENGDPGRQLTIDSRTPRSGSDRLVPQRSTFSGGKHTLSRMDEEAPAEVSMTYRLGDTTSTRIIVNPQDENSPLYRPVETDGTINSAGIYMDVNLQPDLQLQLGGEYSDRRDELSDKTDNSRGASVALKWSF